MVSDKAVNLACQILKISDWAKPEKWDDRIKTAMVQCAKTELKRQEQCWSTHPVYGFSACHPECRR